MRCFGVHCFCPLGNEGGGTAYPTHATIQDPDGDCYTYLYLYFHGRKLYQYAGIMSRFWQQTTNLPLP